MNTSLVRTVVLLSILLLSPILASRLAAAEVPVASVVSGSVTDGQYYPAIANDGQTFLALWYEQKQVGVGNRWVTGAVSGTRFSADGRALDVPNLVFEGVNDTNVFWNGHEYIVFDAKHFIRVGSNGKKVVAGTYSYVSAMDWVDGFVRSENRVLVYGAASIPGSSYVSYRAAIYDLNMNLVQSSPEIDGLPTYSAYNVAAVGDRFLIPRVTYRTGVGDLEISVLDENGKLLARRIAYSVAGTLSPARLISDGSRAVITVGYESRTPKDSGALLVVLNSDGFLSGASKLPDNAGWAWTPAGPSTFVSVASESYYKPPAGVMKVVVNPGGDLTVTTAPFRLSPTAFVGYYEYAFSSANGRHLAIWTESRTTGDSKTNVLQQTSAATPEGLFQGPSRDVGISPATQQGVARARSGEVTLVAWQERHDRFMRPSLYVRRFLSNGVPIDDEPLLVATNTCAESEPSLAASGQTFLIAWNEPHATRAVRLGRDGRLQDPTPIEITTSGATGECRQLGLAAGGAERFTVAWADQDLGGTAVMAYRLLPEKGEMGPIEEIRSNATDVRKLFVASNSSTTVVAWNSTSVSSQYARINSFGLADRTPIAFKIPSLSGLAWTGRSFLAVGSGGYYPGYSLANRLDTSGASIDVKPGAAEAVRLPIQGLEPDITCDELGCAISSIKDDISDTMYAYRMRDDLTPMTFELIRSTSVQTAAHVAPFDSSADRILALCASRSAPWGGSWRVMLMSADFDGRRRAAGH
jgi:hypothetical protein